MRNCSLYFSLRRQPIKTPMVYALCVGITLSGCGGGQSEPVAKSSPSPAPANAGRSGPAPNNSATAAPGVPATSLAQARSLVSSTVPDLHKLKAADFYRLLGERRAEVRKQRGDDRPPTAWKDVPDFGKPNVSSYGDFVRKFEERTRLKWSEFRDRIAGLKDLHKRAESFRPPDAGPLLSLLAARMGESADQGQKKALQKAHDATVRHARAFGELVLAQARFVTLATPLLETASPFVARVEALKAVEQVGNPAKTKAAIQAILAEDGPAWPVFQQVAALNSVEFEDAAVQSSMALNGVKLARTELESCLTEAYEGDAQLRQLAAAYQSPAKQGEDDADGIQVTLDLIIGGLSITLATFTISPVVAIIVAAVMIIVMIILMIVWGPGSGGSSSGGGGGPMPVSGSVPTESRIPPDGREVKLDGSGGKHALVAYDQGQWLVLDWLYDNHLGQRLTLYLDREQANLAPVVTRAKPPAVLGLARTEEQETRPFPVFVTFKPADSDEPFVVRWDSDRQASPVGDRWKDQPLPSGAQAVPVGGLAGPHPYRASIQANRFVLEVAPHGRSDEVRQLTLPAESKDFRFLIHPNPGAPARIEEIRPTWKDGKFDFPVSVIVTGAGDPQAREIIWTSEQDAKLK